MCVCDVTDLMGICEEDNKDEEGSPCGDTSMRLLNLK